MGFNKYGEKESKERPLSTILAERFDASEELDKTIRNLKMFMIIPPTK